MNHHHHQNHVHNWAAKSIIRTKIFSTYTYKSLLRILNCLSTKTRKDFRRVPALNLDVRNGITLFHSVSLSSDGCDGCRSVSRLQASTCHAMHSSIYLYMSYMRLYVAIKHRYIMIFCA